MAYDLRGYIVSEDTKWFYEYFGLPNTAPSDIKDWMESDDCDQVITINSYGGEIFAAAEIFDMIAGVIDINIVGLAASAAGMIAMAGRTVKMSSLAEIMIHNVQTAARGDYRDLKKASDMAKKTNETVRAAYKYRGISDEEIQKMMDKDTWVTAKEALELGLIDEITHGAKVNDDSLEGMPEGGFRNIYEPAVALFNSISEPRAPKQAEGGLMPNCAMEAFVAKYGAMPVKEKQLKKSESASEEAFLMQKYALEIEKNRFGG